MDRTTMKTDLEIIQEFCDKGIELRENVLKGDWEDVGWGNRYEKCIGVKDGDWDGGYFKAAITFGESKHVKNSEFIIHSANTYAPALQALKKLADKSSAVIAEHEHIYSNYNGSDQLTLATKQLKDALREAAESLKGMG